MKAAKLLAKAINSPQNLRFAQMILLAEAFGYRLDRIKGSHHILIHSQAERPLNLPRRRG